MNPYNVSGFYDPNPWEELRRVKETQLRVKEAECYNDIAEAIRNHFPGIEITGAQVAGRVNELLSAEKRLNTSDCNSCGSVGFCAYRRVQTITRINCPLWRPK